MEWLNPLLIRNIVPSDRQHTAMIGSSLGGILLLSLWGLIIRSRLVVLGGIFFS